MTSLYLILDLIVLVMPLALSFDKRVDYFSKWKRVIIAAVLVAIPFIIWDMAFEQNEFWGFNKDYLIGVEIFGLPIEEILFFIVVPFATTFIYECTKSYIPHSWTSPLSYITWLIIVGLFLTIIIVNPTGSYSLSVSIATLFTTLIYFFKRTLKFIGVSYLVSLLPFVLMNGILTGGMTEEPVVWYSELEFSGIRFWTIPIEDFLYSFTLITCVIILYEKLNKSSV